MERRVWLLLLCACLLGCAKLGEGDGVRQADQLAAQKQYGPLAKLLQYPLAPVRARALHHIVRAATPETHKALKAFLRTASPLWRREVLVQLFATERSDPHAISLLARFCDDTKTELRLATIAELGHKPTLAPVLWRCMLEGLGDADRTVSRIAHLGLKQQGVRGLPVLHKALVKSKPPLTARLIRLLQELTAQPWTQRAQWERWFSSGRAKLFALGQSGEWSQQQKLLTQTLRKGSPALRAEAARLLSRLTPTPQAIDKLLASTNPNASLWLRLLGQAGAARLRAWLKANPTKARPDHIRALATWLGHNPRTTQALLLPYLDPKRPAHCHAAIDVLNRSFGAHHPTSQAILKRLKALTTEGSPALAKAAVLALWHAGVSLPQTPQTLLAAYRDAAPAHKARHLDPLVRWAAWHQDRGTIDFLVGQLPRAKDTTLQLNLLASLAYLSHFSSTARAATHAFAMAMRNPQVFGVSGFRLLHAQPPQRRYTWLRLLGPKIAPAQWLTALKALYKRKELGRERHIASSILLRGLSPQMPWLVQAAAARAVAKHRVLACASALMDLLKRAPSYHAQPFIRALEALQYKPAIPLLTRHFKKSKHKNAQWDLAVARWRCGDSSALRWCKRQLKQAKGYIWHVPRRFVRYAIEAKQSAMLLLRASKLKHLLSSPLAALQFTSTPNKHSLVRLLKRYQRRIEPQDAKQRALIWLQQHPTPKLFQLITKHAPTLDKHKQLGAAIALLSALSQSRGNKAKTSSALDTLHQLGKDKRLSKKSRKAIAQALAQRKSKATSSAPTDQALQHQLAEAKRALAKERSPQNLDRLGDAHSALKQYSQAKRFYLLALHSSYQIADQQRLSQKLRTCHKALQDVPQPRPTSRPTATSRPAPQPTTQPTAQPTRPRPRAATQPSKRPAP